MFAQHNISVRNSPSGSVVYAPAVSYMAAQEELFWLNFVKGNITRCNGCGKRDLRDVTGKPKKPPHDLCLRHKEYVVFENPHTGKHQLSSDLRNVYYHTSVGCVTQKFRNFNPNSSVKVSKEVKEKLTAVHFAYLFEEFGLSFLNK